MNAIRPLLDEAVKLHQQGQWAQAEWLYNQILARDGRHADAWHLLGVLDFQRGKLQSALERIGRAISLRPDAAGYYGNLATVQAARGQLRAAAETYRHAIGLAPSDGELLTQFASIVEQLGEVEEAERALRRAVELTPNAANLGRLAHFLENANRLSEARELALRGERLDEADLNCQLALAKCERREGARDESLVRLERLRATHPAAPTDRVLHFELGRLLDETGDCDRAWTCFETGNRLMREAKKHAASPERVTAEIGALFAAFDPGRVALWSRPITGEERPDPVFVVGFPRSGTTLLCQILGGHPGITMLHERPTAHEVKRHLHELPGGYPGALSQLDAGQVAALRATYWRAAGLRGGSELVVDVNPLHLIALGPLLRIFPKARVIALLRHPCDACLSCFMQDFAYTDAMAHFTTVAGAVTLFDQMMRLWRRTLIAVPHACHVMRYETLVSDFDGEMRRALAFLELPWSDELARFAQRASMGGRIPTPSYHQVTQSLYGHAVDRWRKYRKHLEPHLATLAPWLEFTGYDSGVARRVA